MLYYFVQPLAKLALWVFYRHIHFSNLDRVPRDKPVILAANHPTAFIEPCVLACFMGRPLYFLVRGNLFAKGIYDFLLRSLHMLPIFRLKDGGYGKLKNNYSTFQAVFDALEQNRTVMILAEGSTIQCKRLRPLQKGTARLALGAIDYSEKIDEVYVVPVGVNFTYADKPRSEVMVEFGEPLLASNYFQQYQENSNQGIVELTDELFPAMESCLVNIPNESDEALVEYLLQMQRSEYPKPLFPIFNQDPQPLAQEQEAANHISRMAAKDKENLLKKTETYFERLGQFGLPDQTLVQGRTINWADRLALWLGFPFYAIGYWLNAPIVWPGKYISRTRVKTHEFLTPVRWAVNLGTYLILSILVFIISAFTSWWVLAAYAGVLLLGWFSVYYQEFRQACRDKKRLGIVPEPQLKALREQRQLIQQAFSSKAYN
jgi:1-acyl-sn-glycerol-3-phosphate acyltransferase